MRTSSHAVMLGLAAVVATAACIGAIDPVHPAPAPCTGDDGCAEGEHCVAGSCAPSCESDADACRRAGTSCGDTTEACSGALVACAQLPELCEEESPGSVCGGGSCCLEDCGSAACGERTCEGVRCMESCRALSSVQSPTFGDPVWPPDRPSGRSGAAFAVDPATGRGLLFGGSTRTPTPADTLAKTVHGDTWWLEADGVSWTPVATGDAPTPRINARMVFHEARGVFLLFGGLAADEDGVDLYSDELWLFDAGGWRQLLPAVPAPRSRTLHAFAYDPGPEEVVLLGGTASGEPLDDQWALAFDGAEASWRRVEPPAALSPRSGATLARAGAGLVLHGGMASLVPGTAAESDSWLWDGETWTRLALSGEEPTRREQACSVPLPDGRLLLAGGGSTDGPIASPLILDLGAGTLSPVSGFSSRSGCIGGAVGGVPTIGYGVARGKNPDDLWQLRGE